MHRLNARHRAIAEAATEDFGQAADKDQLWNRLHLHLVPFGITGLLYGFNALPRADKSWGLMLHSINPAWLEEKIRANRFYCDEFVRASRVETVPLLWNDTRRLQSMTKQAKESLDIDHDPRFRILAGVTLPNSFNKGLGVSSMGCHAADLTWLEFDHVWNENAVLIQIIIRSFDTTMREKFMTDLISLSPREQECLLGLARGLYPKEIAASLGTSTRTVEHQIKAMRAKLGADTPAEATFAAAAFNLLP